MQLGVKAASLGFPGRPLLFDQLDFTASSGELIGLVGPSGSGKSTLLSVLGGQQRLQAGSVVASDVKRIGWVFQNPVGVPRRSALDHVTYPLLASGLARREAEETSLNLLGRFGLAGMESSLFKALSGGEAQRLMLARAVACDFDAILIDEPTAQLDPISAMTVVDVITETVSARRITIIATHDARVIGRCDRVLDLSAA